MWLTSCKTLPTVFVILSASLYFSSGARVRIFSVAGPFRVHIKKVERCYPTENTAKVQVGFTLEQFQLNGPNGPITINSNMSMPFNLDDKLGARVTLASWSHGFSHMGSWKENSHVFNLKEICKALNFLVPDPYEAVIRNVMGHGLSCPIYAGIYRVTNITATGFGKMPFKQFVYGRWRGDSMLVNADGEYAACLRVYADTLPA